MLGDSLQDDGIHHVRKQVKINNSNFNIYMPFDGLAFIGNKSSGLIWDYKNIEGRCTHFKNKHDETITGNANARDKLQDNEFNFRNDSVKDRIYFKNKDLKTLEDWNNFFANNEVILEYECEEYVEAYTEEQKKAYNKIQELYSYKDITNIECTDEISCSFDIEYCTELSKMKMQIEELEVANTYSENEVKIGKWIGGKNIYRKIINFGQMPNNATKEISIDTANISQIVKLYGIAQSVDRVFQFPQSTNSTSNVFEYTLLDILFSTKKVRIRTNEDKTSYNAYVIIEYTKK